MWASAVSCEIFRLILWQYGCHVSSRNGWLSKVCHSDCWPIEAKLGGINYGWRRHIGVRAVEQNRSIWKNRIFEQYQFDIHIFALLSSIWPGKYTLHTPLPIALDPLRNDRFISTCGHNWVRCLRVFQAFQQFLIRQLNVISLRSVDFFLMKWIGIATGASWSWLIDQGTILISYKSDRQMKYDNDAICFLDLPDATIVGMVVRSSAVAFMALLESCLKNSSPMRWRLRSKTTSAPPELPLPEIELFWHQWTISSNIWCLHSIQTLSNYSIWMLRVIN